MISLLVPIISVILAFLIGYIIMAALSANPAVALRLSGRAPSAA